MEKKSQIMNVQKRRNTVRKIRELADELLRTHTNYNLQPAVFESNLTLNLWQLNEFLAGTKKAVAEDRKETTDIASTFYVVTGLIQSIESLHIINNYPSYAKTLKEIANDLQNDL